VAGLVRSSLVAFVDVGAGLRVGRGCGVALVGRRLFSVVGPGQLPRAHECVLSSGTPPNLCHLLDRVSSAILDFRSAGWATRRADRHSINAGLARR